MNDALYEGVRDAFYDAAERAGVDIRVLLTGMLRNVPDFVTQRELAVVRRMAAELGIAVTH
jgi:hypothetical protein